MKKILFILLSISIIAESQSFVPDAPELDVKSYILIEPNTNTIIAEYNSESEIEPASMTKIMTSYVVADQISNGLISLDDEVLISEKAWRMKGSKTFIEAGKKVTVSDLLKGIMIQSGNDASVAIAEYAGGTERGFVDLMNSYASSLGMNNTIFQNATGLPDENHFSSAKDLANLTSNYINKFPEEYALYKQKEFTFNNIKQLNRNKLLWRDDSADGVKTGHTEAAGYCLVGSAKRGGMRLITVVAGSKSDNDRFLSSQRLLEYGFRFYTTQKMLIAEKEYQTITIWGGEEKSLGVGVLEDISITLPRTSFKDVKTIYKVNNNIQAPIKIGQKVGTLEIISNDNVVLATDLVALKNIKAKGFFGRMWSKFVLWVFSLFGLAGDDTD
jgi:D-alanyl-D-alanine carboxypeptidase (penicillin-binding protein 5/6)